jgi:hypothetical protein
VQVVRQDDDLVAPLQAGRSMGEDRALELVRKRAPPTLPIAQEVGLGVDGREDRTTRVLRLRQPGADDLGHERVELLWPAFVDQPQHSLGNRWSSSGHPTSPGARLGENLPAADQPGLTAAGDGDEALQGKLRFPGLPIGFGILLEQDTYDLADRTALGGGSRSDPKAKRLRHPNRDPRSVADGGWIKPRATRPRHPGRKVEVLPLDVIGQALDVGRSEGPAALGRYRSCHRITRANSGRNLALSGMAWMTT